ncbi:MAG: hypothetical protein SF051_11445 [Elusimicrobiota bacterium]|nr:hypothetical protein [Elusimicrobiota bacterium]
MNALLLMVALAHAAPAPSPSAPQAEFLPARREPNWLKAYPVTPFREFWTGDLQVKKLDKAVPAIVELVEKSGASLTQGLDAYISSDKTKQLSVSIPQKKAKDFLKKLQKLGVMAEPRSQQGLPRPDMDELRAKIDRLIKERVAKKAALAEVPASAEAADEVLEQLLNAEALAKRTEDAVLLNLTVREAP